MKNKPSAFSFVPATREGVSIIIAIAGASGSGKTRTALELARGLADGDDSKIAVIDTESGRARHYAVRPGEQPGPGRFAFMHGDLTAPFSPDRYIEAINAAEEAGAKVIVVDSASHEWEGDGGLHDMQHETVEQAIRIAEKNHNPNWGPFDPQKAAERAGIAAWKEPKRLHKRFVTRLLQSRAHLILCLRAEEKLLIEQVVDDRGRKRTQITQAKDLPAAQRWTPICEKRFMYEMTLSMTLSPETPGVPAAFNKLQDQHRAAFPQNELVGDRAGRLLSAWAAGENITADTDIKSLAAKKSEAKPAAKKPAPKPENATPGEPTKKVVQPDIKKEEPEPPASPNAATYLYGWEMLLEDDQMTAAQLHSIWVEGKAIRNKILWPEDNTFEELKTRVQQQIAKLKAAGQ